MSPAPVPFTDDSTHAPARQSWHKAWLAMHLPLRWLSGLWVLTLLASLGMAVSWNVQRSQHAQTLTETFLLEQQIALLKRQLAPPDRDSRLEFVLPKRARFQELTRDIGQWSDKLGLHIIKLNVSHIATTPSHQGHVQFQIAINGSYASTKQFLGLLMDRYESLAVQSLSIQSKVGDPLRQEWDVSLQLYVRD